jgi:hypothetical protein
MELIAIFDNCILLLAVETGRGARGARRCAIVVRGPCTRPDVLLFQHPWFGLLTFIQL